MSFLDELYYGNINPNENRNRKPLPYEQAVRTFSDIESRLSKELNGENVKLLMSLLTSPMLQYGNIGICICDMISIQTILKKLGLLSLP